MDDFAMGLLAGQNDNNCGNGGGVFGDNGSWIFAIVILALIFGRNGGLGGFGGDSSGNGTMAAVLPYMMNNGGFNASAADTRAAITDGFNTDKIITKLDGISNGICSLGYDQLGQMNGINANLAAGFRTIDNAVCTLGYQAQAGFNGIGNQIAQCCCDTRAAIGDVKTQGVMNTNAIQQQIQMCCCDNEKQLMQNRYDAAQMNCNTLQAIDKLGDRILGYMADKETAALRDEVASLRLSASQQMQNNYLIQQLRPAPVPAFAVPAPYCYGTTNNSGCGC